MDQNLLIPFLGGWTSIYQLFWCSPGVQGFDTLPYIYIYNIYIQATTCYNHGPCLSKQWRGLHTSVSTNKSVRECQTWKEECIETQFFQGCCRWWLRHNFHVSSFRSTCLKSSFPWNWGNEAGRSMDEAEVEMFPVPGGSFQWWS